jgi:chromosome segregation ATPase
MVDKIEGSIKSLIREFNIIKKSLEPLVEDIQKIKALEVEFRKFKEDTSSHVRKLEFENQKLNSEKTSKIDTRKIQELEKQMEQKILSVNRQMDTKGEVSKDEITRIHDELRKQNMLFTKKSGEIDEKHIALHSSNREMIASLISESHYLKKQFEKELLASEKNVERLNELDKWFKDRDSTTTKEMNVRRRHINQIASELNEARKRDHTIAKELDDLISKAGEAKTERLKILNRIDNIDKVLSAKADNVKIDDMILNFSRLEKKTIAEIGEMKARMRELERKSIGKTEIETVRKDIEELKVKVSDKKGIDTIQTAVMEKLKSELDALNQKIRAASESFNIEMVKTDQNNANILKKETAALNAEISALTQKLSSLGSLPNKEQYEYKKDVVNRIKGDVDAATDMIKSFKKDLSETIARTSELYALKEPLKSTKQDMAAMNSKFESGLQSIRADLDRINIKVENTSKLLKDLDKVL